MKYEAIIGENSDPNVRIVGQNGAELDITSISINKHRVKNNNNCIIINPMEHIFPGLNNNQEKLLPAFIIFPYSEIIVDGYCGDVGKGIKGSLGNQPLPFPYLHGVKRINTGFSDIFDKLENQIDRHGHINLLMDQFSIVFPFIMRLKDYITIDNERIVFQYADKTLELRDNNNTISLHNYSFYTPKYKSMTVYNAPVDNLDLEELNVAQYIFAIFTRKLNIQIKTVVNNFTSKRDVIIQKNLRKLKNIVEKIINFKEYLTTICENEYKEYARRYILLIIKRIGVDNFEDDFQVFLWDWINGELRSRSLIDGLKNKLKNKSIQKVEIPDILSNEIGARIITLHYEMIFKFPNHDTWNYFRPLLINYLKLFFSFNPIETMDINFPMDQTSIDDIPSDRLFTMRKVY